MDDDAKCGTEMPEAQGRRYLFARALVHLADWLTEAAVIIHEDSLPDPTDDEESDDEEDDDGPKPHVRRKARRVIPEPSWMKALNEDTA